MGLSKFRFRYVIAWKKIVKFALSIEKSVRFGELYDAKYFKNARNQQTKLMF